MGTPTAAGPSAAVDRFDMVIRDGIVVDGTAQRYRADIGIRDGASRASGGPPVRRRARARRERHDRRAGFIDLHTHYDAQVFWDPY